MASGVDCGAGDMTSLLITLFGCNVDAGNFILGPIPLLALTSPPDTVIEDNGCPCVFCTGVETGGVGVVIAALCEETETSSLTMDSFGAKSTDAELKPSFICF